MNMIEKVARAIAGHYGKEFDDCPKDYKEGRKLYRAGKVDLSDVNQDEHMEAAKAAIEAMEIPTKDMISAAERANVELDGKLHYTRAYGIMIKTALGDD